jgi:8-oxo-dGTP pyrophosphatase MutT (NUDIX family)
VNTERRMITFGDGARVFTYRVAAVAMTDGHVLLNRAEPDNYWFMPGGRVELGESSVIALRREMREEIGLEVKVERLLWIVENFFPTTSGTHHEMGLYFLIILPPSLHLQIGHQFVCKEENGTDLIFQWHRVAELKTLNLVPGFLRDGLASLPHQVTHVIHGDDGVSRE